jgi:hypothetical protein
MARGRGRRARGIDAIYAPCAPRARAPKFDFPVKAPPPHARKENRASAPINPDS